MVSKYFEIKIKTQDFINNLNDIINTFQNKKVLIYGAGQGFEALNKEYNLCNKLNIVAFADKRFENCSEASFCNKKAISPDKISQTDFDVILVSNEIPQNIVNFLVEELCISKEVRTIFVPDIKDEAINLNYLYEYNFDKTLPKLVKKLKNKTIMLYGAGAFLEVIKKYFDITGLNIIGIADKRFEENEEFLGYKTFTPDKITEIKPDYVLVSTKYYVNIIESLYYDTLKNSKIKIKPLLKKPLFTLIKEIWG